MKIAIVVPRIHVLPGFEDVVSAHVQLPLKTATLLSEHGHEVDIITTTPRDGFALPSPEGILVHTVADSFSAGGEYRDTGRRPTLSIFSAVRQARDIRRVVATKRFDIIHFFGGLRMASLAGLLVITGLAVPAVFTIDSSFASRRHWLISRFLWKRLPKIITSTPFLGGQLRAYGVNAEVIRPGVARDLRMYEQGSTPSVRKRVLFWRDPSIENGADVCQAVYAD